MSGPVTLEFLLLQGALLGTRAVLESARDVHAGWQAAQAEAIRAAQLRLERARDQRAREVESIRAHAERSAALEASLARLARLAETLRASFAASGLSLEIPEAPPASVAGEERVRALEAALQVAQSRMSEVAARLAADGSAQIDAATLGQLVAPQSIDALFDAYARANAAERAGEAALARRDEIDRVLGPLRALQGNADVLPAEIERVVRELAAPVDAGRASALELELRRLVAEERARREVRERDRAQAAELLRELDELVIELSETETAALPAELNAVRQRLVLASAALADFPESLAVRARALAQDLRAERDRQVKAAAAEVLQSALADLGFVAEPISDTLFVDGGVAHFTRAEWGDYAVRLRANTTDGTLNFNVVRERGTEAADPLSTRLRDTAAEERWCAHIPKLTETLEARGIRLKVRRMLGAGEAPAQVVPQGTLAPLASEERRQTVAPRKAEL